MTINLYVHENAHVSISIAHIYKRTTHRKTISELGLQGEDDMAHQFDTVRVHVHVAIESVWVAG